MQMEITQKIIDIISESLNEDDVKVESRLVNDLQADSIDIVEIIMKVEKEFNFYFDDTELQAVYKSDFRVQDLINLTNKYLNKRS